MTVLMGAVVGQYAPHRDNAIDRRAETEETAPKTMERTREALDDEVRTAKMAVTGNCFVIHPDIL